MKIYALDDEQSVLRGLRVVVCEAEPGCAFFAFSDPESFLATVKEDPCDVAFIGEKMHDVLGFEVARQLLLLSRSTNIVFIADHGEYTREAFDLFASGYIQKSPAVKDIRLQLDNLRYPVAPVRCASGDGPSSSTSPRIVAKTFGSFDVMVDGRPIEFSRSKSKEVLAYLILERGARVSTAQIASALWGVAPTVRQRRYVNVLAACLRKSLIEAGAGCILREGRGSLAVDPDSFECDLYRASADGLLAISECSGGFMSQYPWAEKYLQASKTAFPGK